MEKSSITAEQATEYATIIRQTTWIVLFFLAATLPFDQLQTIPIAALLTVGVIGNLLRHNKWLMAKPWFASRISALILDNIFVAALLLMVGRIDMAYTALLGLTVISSTFWYGYRGLIIVLIGQCVVLGAAGSGFIPVFPAIDSDPLRTAVLAIGMLFSFGYLVGQLSRVQRAERKAIDKLHNWSTVRQASLDALLESTDNAVVLVDASGAITAANTVFHELIAQKESLEGKTLATLLPLQHNNDQLMWPTALEGAPQYIHDYSFVTASGTKIPLDINITRSQTADKDTVGYVVLIKNLSDQQSLTEQQSSFIAIASHELRTPITFIEAALSVALGPTEHVSDKARPLLQKAHDHTMFVSQLIEDLTTLYMAQNGGINLQLQTVDPKKLVGQAVYDYTELAHQKGITLTGEAAVNLPAVLTSEYYVLQILRNFVSNAVKYTKTGSVTVNVTGAAHGGLLFSVKDTGVGIAKKDQDDLFTQFFQAENYKTREQGGAGIGLYLSNQLAKRINAHLRFESELGVGSTFYLEVPPLSGLKKDTGEIVNAGMENLLEQI